MTGCSQLLRLLLRVAEWLGRNLARVLGLDAGDPEVARWTGVLALAALALSAYVFGRRPDGDDGAAGAGPGPARPGAAASRAALAAKMGLPRSVCVSTLGTVFEEARPGELSTTATVKKDQVETLQFLAKYTRVFLLTQCADDAGEAQARRALAGAGLVDDEKFVAAHNVLFCGTAKGKVAVVRQMEPDLYVDAEAAVLRELQRFNHKVALVGDGPGGEPPLAGGSGGRALVRVGSLSAYFRRS